MRNGTDRLRALNAPQRVRVELDEQRRPRVVKREAGNEKRVESFGENWRMDDEWWRQPIVRRYVEVVLEGGGRVVLFEDLITGEWFVQMPTLFDALSPESKHVHPLRIPHSAFRIMYIELHCHSAFSFLDGASLPEQLALTASQLGYPALALTDHHGLYGSMAFAQEAKQLGLQAI